MNENVSALIGIGISYMQAFSNMNIVIADKMLIPVGAETFQSLARLRGMECRSHAGYAEAFREDKNQYSIENRKAPLKGQV
jgi:hypothetical protein